MTNRDTPPGLFALPTHAADPITSKAVARRHARESQGHAMRVLAVLARKPGLNYHEVAVECQIDDAEANRRLSDLKRCGAVRVEGERGGRGLYFKA